MIEKISVTNFKNHADTEIKLGRVTAVVGPNGCGKTSLLQALLSLNQLADGIIKTGSWSLELIRNSVRRGEHNQRISVVGKEPHWQMLVSLINSTSDIIWELNHIAWKQEKSLLHRIDNNPILPNEDDEPVHRKVFGLFGNVIYFKGVASHIAQPSYTLDTHPQISLDGNGLASTLAYLMTYDRSKHLQIEAALRSIVPTVTQIRAKPTIVNLKEKKIFSVNNTQVPYEEEREVSGQELIFDTLSGNEIPAQAMSEGTLFVLGLLSVLHSASPNAKTFLLDDIEQGLHPLAQRQLMTTLKEFAEKHDKQIVLTSHSPYIVDELDAKDVWVMNTDQEGISHCKRLSDHPDATRLLEVLTTGELEGAVGEDWVLPNKALAEEVNA